MPTNPETPIQDAIQVEVGKIAHVRMFRNMVGNGVVGRITHGKASGEWHVKNGTRVAFGMAPGSPDLNGWETITITQDMVGQQIARVLMIEVKTATGYLSLDQKRFIAMAREMGCKVLVCRSPEEAVAGIMNGESEDA